LSFRFEYETNIEAESGAPPNFHVMARSGICILIQIQDRKSYFAIPDFTDVVNIFSTFSQDARNYSTHSMLRRLGVHYPLNTDSSKEK